MSGDQLQNALRSMSHCVTHLFDQSVSGPARVSTALEEGGSLLCLFSLSPELKEQAPVFEAWHAMLETQLQLADAFDKCDDDALAFDKQHGKLFTMFCGQEKTLRALPGQNGVVSTWASAEQLKQNISARLALTSHLALEEAAGKLNQTYEEQAAWGTGLTLTSSWSDIQKASKGLFVEAFAKSITANFSNAQQAMAFTESENSRPSSPGPRRHPSLLFLFRLDIVLKMPTGSCTQRIGALSFYNLFWVVWESLL